MDVVKGLKQTYDTLRCLYKYQIKGELTHTESSILYYAINRKTKEKLVLKQCYDDELFKREVAISSKIFSHGYNNYVLPLVDQFPDKNCLVVPYLEGGDLYDFREYKKGLTPEEGFAITSQIGRGLEHIHAAGVIHADVKSANILLADADAQHNSDRTPLVKLTDFGLSRGSLPEPNHDSGTPEYMAPELLLLEPPTPAVDIYSLGLVLHEILSNTLLYDQNSNITLHDKIPPHQRIPMRVLEVIRTACEIKPTNRYKNATEMVSDLERAVYSC